MYQELIDFAKVGGWGADSEEPSLTLKLECGENQVLNRRISPKHNEDGIILKELFHCQHIPPISAKAIQCYMKWMKKILLKS